MGRPNLFNSGNVNSRRALTNSVRSEIDLRSEFDLFIFGDGKDAIPHGRPFIIRRMRRNPDSTQVECTCLRAGNTIEPDPSCSYCHGEGHLYDEEWLIGFTMMGGADSGLVNRQTWMPPGAVRIDYRIFFFRYDANIRYGDKILIPRLDAEGVPVSPLGIEAIHKPQTIDEKRSDGGRLEFYTLYAREEDAIRPDVV